MAELQDIETTEERLKPKPEFTQVLYGMIFAFYGVWLVSLDSIGFGVLLTSVATLKLGVAFAFLFTESPRIRLIQAVDSLAIAIALLLGALANDFRGSDYLSHPVVLVVLAIFMVGAALGGLMDYRDLQNVRSRRARSPSKPPSNVESVNAESIESFKSRLPDDDTSEQTECVDCGNKIPAGIDTCPSCGWSYL